MKTLEEYIAMVKPAEKKVLQDVQTRLDSQTKPPGSLGKLEELCKQLAKAQVTANPCCDRRIIFTMAADHGVAREGTSAYPQSVTAQMVANFINGGAAVNVLAKHGGCEVVVVDMGVCSDLECRGFVNRKIDYGTRSFARGPAMSMEQARRAVEAGIQLALDYDFDVLGTGDMGIGNTAASSAVASVLMGRDPAEVTGKGTGIDDRMLHKKIEVIRTGIAVNRPDPQKPLEVLSRVGGFEIGGIAGLILGAAIKKKLAVVDGFISTAGAMIAHALSPAVDDYFIISHLSAERGHHNLVGYLGKSPLLDLEMRLGEGTGSAVAMEVLDAAVRLYYDMATFDQAGVDKKA
ncbi:MAG: nicotinate-nucleotide--dimethylbenzimidazole phosphoribosyltransferase [Spirochaetota bacterium]